MIRSEWGIKACKHAAEQEDADPSGDKLKITALTKMFKVFAGEFEGEPFLKGSPSIKYNHPKSFSICSRTNAEMAPVRMPAYSSG